MHIQITEHKSVGTLRPAAVGNCVRVFVDRDYQYGYFVDEHLVFSKLTEEQQKAYLAAKYEILFDVPEQIAQELIADGYSPYK
jgi:hypothetical protein